MRICLVSAGLPVARSVIVAAAACLAAICVACDRSRPTTQPTAALEPPVTPPAVLPEYRFAPGLCDEHEAVCAFVREFLETCLAGDYAGYRGLVSRYENPESRERFEAIYHALRAVEVQSIEPVQRPDGPAFLVVSSVQFDPQSNVSLRHRNRSLAILAVQELDQWRMRVAPPELQPREPDDAPAPEPQSQPADAPEYPWDEEP